MDIIMPGTDGIKALQLIRKEYEDLKDYYTKHV